MDVGFGDALSIIPEEITFPVLLGMKAPKLRAYSRETVVAEKLEAIVELGMVNTRFKDYFDLHFLALKFAFEGAALSTSIAMTFNRRGTPFPDGLPVGLTPTFSQDPAKMLGWEAFCRKTVSKAAVPALDEIVQRLIEFLEPPLAAAAKGEKLRKNWGSAGWTEV